MATVTEICQHVVEDFPESLACGVVDIETGMLLGMHHAVPYFSQPYLEAIAAAAVEMFRGRTVKRVEELLSRQRGKPVKDSFEEIFISSPTVYHFMKLIHEKDAIAVLVTRKNTSQGMGWATLRNTIEVLVEALP